MHLLQRGWLCSNNILFLFLGRGQAALPDSGYAIHAPQTLALVAHLQMDDDGRARPYR
jgi:hypothetical protein